MSGARSTKATDYTSEPAAHCTSAKAVDCRSEPGTHYTSASASDYKSVAAKNRGCPGSTAYCGSPATEARRNVRHSSSSDGCHSYSAPSCAARNCSHQNRDDQSIGDGRHREACDRVAEADSRDDLTRRILPARGHGRLNCPGLPKSASCPLGPAACCPSSNQACAASFPLRKAAGFARDHAAAESFRLHRETSPGVRYSQSRCVPENQGQHGDRSSLR